MVRLPSSLLALAALPAIMLAGCNGGSGQAPSAAVAAASGDCKSQKAEMSQLVNRGVEGEISAAEAGRKLSPEAQGRVDRYNALLNSYLGNGCHSS